MQVIALNGSSRKNGNTDLILQTVLDVLTEHGIAGRIIQLCDKKLDGCLACFKCKGLARCVVQDDFNECLEALKAAEGLLLGSPVYSADVSAKMKAFCERAGVVAATNPGIFRRKAGAAVAAVRRAGGMQAVDTMNHFFLNKEFIVPGATYWNMVYGRDVGEVLRDEEGMANMKNLGENMAWLLKQLHSGRNSA